MPLGQNLFFIYINDIIVYAKNFNISLFADDSMFYLNGTNENIYQDERREILNGIYIFL